MTESFTGFRDKSSQDVVGVLGKFTYHIVGSECLVDHKISGEVQVVFLQKSILDRGRGRKEQSVWDRLIS